MASITAVLHTENDALRLGRALETVYPCDHILVIDYGSQDATVRVAREYGAKVIDATPGLLSQDYLQFAQAEWVLSLEPYESLTEKLAASLFEWKSEGAHRKIRAPAFSLFIREETADGWIEIPIAETRLVPRDWNRWQGRHPVTDPSALALEGELLRFKLP